jgi:hypothetical protein
MPGKATDSTHAILRDLTQCDSGDDCRRHSADAEPATPMAGDGPPTSGQVRGMARYYSGNLSFQPQSSRRRYANGINFASF